MTYKTKKGDGTVKQLVAILTVIALVFSCAAICAAAGLLVGDANGDGVVNTKDVLSLRRYLAALSTTIALPNADANGDGAVNTKDVLWLRKTLADLDPNAPTPTRTTAVIPTSDEELRGVWLAYYEIDGLLKSTPAATKTAIDNAFDTCRAFGLNTVFFHVRAKSDAYYNSKIFPPVAAVKSLLNQGFDPLSYAVESAHSRGLALHAWLNPYRVGDGKNAVCPDTFTFDKTVYYSPSSETVKTTLLSGIEEILKNYAVDGIHFDDYFYPSGVPTTAQAFDVGYTAACGNLADWRRAQVTDFIQRAYALTHALSKTAQFGISPAGNPDSDRNTLYADVETWLKTAGCVDYLCPQLYYGFQNSAAPFADVLTQWNTLPRASGVRLYVGLSVYKAGIAEDIWAGTGKAEWATGGDILARQVATLRAESGVSGFALFSYTHLTGAGFDKTCDKTVIQKELDNLKRALVA